MRVAARARLRWSGLVLVGIHLLALGADWIAPYDYAAQHRDFAYSRPTKVRFVDHEGRFHLRPFVYAQEQNSALPSGLAGESPAIAPIRFFVPSPPRQGLGVFTAKFRLFGVDEPARLFLLGTDHLGRDLFSRLLYGARVSLFAGLFGAALSVTVGLALGTLAGFYGGRTDDVLMRLTELFLALPWLYLLFGVRAVLPLELGAMQALLLFVAIVAGIGWARPARLFRGVTLATKKRTFVAAARAVGASDSQLLRHHILPHNFRVFRVQFALLVPRFVLAEVTLSFLGLGVGEPVPSLGSLLAVLQEYHVLVSYGWMFAPAVALLAVVLCYQLLADGIGEQARA